MNISIEALILFMAIITFACRYLFFMKSIPITLGLKTKQLLKYTAPSVLTAMWIPIVFLGHKTSEVSLYSSPFLYAGIITLLASLKFKNTLSVVLIGMVSFVIIKWLI